LKLVRMTEGRATLDMIAEVSRLAVLDAGLEPGMIDGLLVGPQLGETPQHVPATVAEYLGIAPTMANVVDLGGASGPGMVWRAAAAIDAGMCEAVLCILANTRELQAPRSLNRNPIREFGVPFGASGANISLCAAEAVPYGALRIARRRFRRDRRLGARQRAAKSDGYLLRQASQRSRCARLADGGFAPATL
jgi:hypothetical protein